MAASLGPCSGWPCRAGGEQEASFFTVVVWRDQAEHAAQSLAPGGDVGQHVIAERTDSLVVALPHRVLGARPLGHLGGERPGETACRTA